VPFFSPTYFAFMSRKYKIHDQEDLHFLSYAVVGWVDALSRPIYKDIIVESLAFCQKAKGLQLFAWCIMSNHVHLIAKAMEGLKLQDIMPCSAEAASRLRAIALQRAEARRRSATTRNSQPRRSWKRSSRTVRKVGRNGCCHC
jgi:REP element-mobilizing transposase RayT